MSRAAKDRRNARVLPLTPEAIEDFPRPKRRWRYYRDPGADHLFIGIGPSSRRWVWYGKVHGRPKRIGLGPYPGLTPEKARSKAADLNIEHSEGKGEADLTAVAKKDMTLHELFEDFVANRRGKKTGRPLAGYTIKLYRHILAKWLKPWHDTPITGIQQRDIANLHEKIGKTRSKVRRRSGEAMTTVANRTVTLLSSLFDHASGRGYYGGENPAAGITRFPEDERDRWVEGREMPKLLAAIAAEPNIDIRDFVLLALLTGQRKSNVLSMRWEELDLAHPDGARWTIPASKTKARKKQTVPLAEQAVAIIRSRSPAPNGYVFASSASKSGHLIYPDSGWQRTVTRAGLKDLRLHDLRRTLGSWQARLGASLLVIGKSLGHTDSRSTQIYARVDQDPVRQSVERATAAILETVAVNAPKRPPRPRLTVVKGRRS